MDGGQDTLKVMASLRCSNLEPPSGLSEAPCGLSDAPGGLPDAPGGLPDAPCVLSDTLNGLSNTPVAPQILQVATRSI